MLSALLACFRLCSRVAVLAPVLAGLNASRAPAAEVHPLADRARTALLDALVREKFFVKVHAAEALIALGDREKPRKVFLAELPAAADQRPYRIGVWRVLAASAPTPADRAPWLERTAAVLLDPSAPDRVHAAESLGKLGHVPAAPVLDALRAMSRGTDADAAYPRWVLHLAGDPTALPALIANLASSDPIARLRAAYVLRWESIKTPPALAALAAAADRESPTAPGYAYVLGSAVALDAAPARVPAWIAALEQVLAHGSVGARYDVCQTFMRRYGPADLPRLAPLLDRAEGDLRIGAAWAILHVLKAHSAPAAPAATPPR